ncbi:MAG: hypothetical protein NVSMB27_10440 [Ktedonobacteraceae bacterium]
MHICEITHSDYSSLGEEGRHIEAALGRITYVQVSNYKRDIIGQRNERSSWGRVTEEGDNQTR